MNAILFPKTKKKEAISYVCADCGDLYLTPKQRYEERISTWHIGKCGLCGEITAVNHIRHFNYLRRPA